MVKIIPPIKLTITNIENVKKDTVKAEVADKFNFEKKKT